MEDGNTQQIPDPSYSAEQLKQIKEMQMISAAESALPLIAQIVKERNQKEGTGQNNERLIFFGIIIALLGVLSVLGWNKVIDGATTGTLLGSIIGYVLGSIKETFYNK